MPTALIVAVVGLALSTLSGCGLIPGTGSDYVQVTNDSAGTVQLRYCPGQVCTDSTSRAVASGDSTKFSLSSSGHPNVPDAVVAEEDSKHKCLLVPDPSVGHIHLNVSLSQFTPAMC